MTDTGMSGDATGQSRGQPMSGAQPPVPQPPATPSPDSDVNAEAKIGANADKGNANGPQVSDPPTSNPLAAGPYPPALDPRLAEVAKIADPHLRQQVEANVRLQTQRQIAAFTDQQRQVKAQAKAIIDQGGDLSSIPAKLMLQIDMPGRQALHDYVLAHGNPATDPVTYYGLKNQALDDPAGFQAVDLTNHMAQLKPADYHELQQLQSNLRNGQPPADLPLQQVYKANTDRMLQQLGLPTDNNGDPQAVQAALQLRRMSDLHLAAEQVATGKPVTPSAHQDLLQQIALYQRPVTPNATGYQSDQRNGSRVDDISDALVNNSASLVGAPNFSGIDDNRLQQSMVPPKDNSVYWQGLGNSNAGNGDSFPQTEQENKDRLALSFFEKAFVTKDLERQIKHTLKSMTGMPDPDIDDMYKQMLDNIEYGDATKFKNINPNNNPLDLSPAQGEIVKKQIDKLSPAMRDKALQGLKKAIEQGRVRCPNCG